MISKEVKGNLDRASWIRAMFEKGSEMKKIHGEENVFDFSLGNPDLEPPEKVIESFKSCAAAKERGTHSYMNNAGYMPLREKIVAQSTESYGIDIPAENIITTCGAAGGLNVILKTLLDPGDEVIILSPFFVEYIFYIQNANGTPIICKTGNDFQPDVENFQNAITAKTKAVILNSPNNPTGVIYSREKLKQLADIIDSHRNKTGSHIAVISDEPYRELVYDGAEIPDMIDIFDDCIIVYSYSKSLSLPGERIGYILASPKMDGVKEFISGAVFCNRTLGFVNAPAFIQRVLSGSLDSIVDPLIYKERRDILYDKLTELGFECIKPQGAFYLFPKSPVEDELAFTSAALEHKLLLVPGRGFGAQGYFRISYCIKKETILASLPQFEKLASEYF